MANVTLTPQDLTSAGVTVTRTALSTSDTYIVRVPPGGVVINWRKTGAGQAIVTVQTPGTVDGLAIAERTVTVPASTGDVAGVYRKEPYADSSGDLRFTVDEDTGLTAAVLRNLG